MDKAMLWGFSVAMYVIVGLQWSRLLERADPQVVASYNGTDLESLRQDRMRKLIRGAMFAAGLAAIIARHFSLLK